MENQKCVLCQKEIKGKCYIITKPDKDSYYMSSEESLIGKCLCEDEVCEDDEEEQGFCNDIDGSIWVKVEKNGGIYFFFKSKILHNNFQSNVSNEKLKEICDIVKNIDIKEIKDHEEYFEGKQQIGNLEKAITINSADITSDSIVKPLHDALNHWNKKIYLVLTGIPEKSKLELYVNKEDKAEFIKLANEKMQGYNM